ncbi:MAG: amidohydrolase family protein [Daejeonella sp.]|uniref:amidohydrolase family protein n=1 Tax=Daejeonella sp. TaxID=2805397 RepID=UPI003C72DC42
MMKIIFLTLIALSVSCTCFSQTQTNTYSLVLENASVVNVTTGKIAYKRLIAISGDTIKAIDDTKKVKQYKADRYIDLSGKYVMPGLWDMHVHFRGGDGLIQANKDLLPLFLSYGITTVRECGGDMTPSVMNWRKQITEGTLAGPRIFTSGPKIDGPKSTWAGSLEVETPEQVTKALDSLQKINVDFVKIYESKISGQTFLDIITQAENRGLTTSGHMPYSVKLKDAVERGLDASEHLYYIFKACSSKEDSITNAIIQSENTARPIGLFAALPSIYNTYDAKTADRLFRYLGKRKFSLVPTLFISKTLNAIKETDHSADKLLPYIDSKLQATYAGRVNSAKRASDESTAFSKKYALKASSLIPQMQRRGINIMAGSDCGAYNSYVYPGESLHEELKLLVASGLTPAQALQSATINGARFMGVNEFYGSLARGKSSDLIVLDTNPLNNIQAIDQINMVISNGKAYNRLELDKLLNSIKR